MQLNNDRGYMVIKQFKFKSKIQILMSKKGDNNTQNNEQQRKKKAIPPQEQKQPAEPKTPEKKQYAELNQELFNLMSPFQLPPKFNHQFTAASMGNYGFSHDMKVIQTPYHHKPSFLRTIEVEEINQDLRQITGKIDWGNTPAKSDHLSSDEEQDSEIASSSQIIPEQNQEKSQLPQKSLEQDENPQKNTANQPNKHIVSRTDRQRHFTKRLSHQKKLMQQLLMPEPNTLGKKVFCNCKKTKCLKLYCDCFRINQTCDGCNCQGCHNLQEYAEQRNNAILVLMDRNPDPFSQKINEDKHLKGCNCKKSFCLKKYCECYQAGLRCGENCKCDQCKNGGGSQKREMDRMEREIMMLREQQIEAN